MDIFLLNNFFDYYFNVHLLIEFGGLLLILGIIYLETGFLLGFVLPGGDYLLFTAGIFCGTSYLEVPVLVLVLLTFLAAFLGDITGYYKGKWLGNKFFTDNTSRFFKKDYLEKGRHFYERFGIWAFILGKFMPVVRTLVPMIAGASGFPRRKFAIFDIPGALLWTGSLVPLGYYVGRSYPDILKYSVYILLLFVLVASSPAIKILITSRKKKHKDKQADK